MLRFLVEKSKEKLWDYGPVTMSIVDLEGIEMQYDVLQRYDGAGREKVVADTALTRALCGRCTNDSDKVRTSIVRCGAWC
jgi:hypothetical protein